MSEPTDYIRVPRETAGDDHATLVEWLVGDGTSVEKGAAICTVEMSKTEMDLEAPRAGWLFHLCQEKEEVAIGSPVAIVSDSEERPATQELTPISSSGGVKVSRKAQELINEYGLTLDAFDGLTLVRERDVRQVLDEEGEPDLLPDSEHIALTPIQRAVAQIVSESHSTIPHSYLSHWLDGKSCEARLAKLSATYDISASVADLLTFAAARSAAAIPKANSGWGGDVIRWYKAINVGFALNLEGGDLVVPVISDANQLEFDKLVGSIRAFQIKARRKNLTPADLTGGTLTVTSLIGSGAQQVLPIIVPETSVILAIGDQATGSFGGAYCLTLGFDHRVLNGHEASQFLLRVAQEMTAGENQ